MSDRYQRGLARKASMGTDNTARTAAYDELVDLAPDVARLATEFAYGDIHSRDGLELGQRELVILAALTALGDVDQQIEAHVASALGAGLDTRAIVETFIQTIPYVGFPRAIHALTAAKRVLQNNEEQPGPSTANGGTTR